MKITRSFHGESDRYELDFGQCSFKQGFAQVDTDQDAWYFGTWINPARMVIVTYAEGDLTVEQAESENEFKELALRLVGWEGFKGIDPAGNDAIVDKLADQGLAFMLH